MNALNKLLEPLSEGFYPSEDFPRQMQSNFVQIGRASCRERVYSNV